MNSLQRLVGARTLHHATQFPLFSRGLHPILHREVLAFIFVSDRAFFDTLQIRVPPSCHCHCQTSHFFAPSDRIADEGASRVVIPRNRTSLVSYSPLREEEEGEGDEGPDKLASGQSGEGRHEDDDDDPAGLRSSADVEDRQVRGERLNGMIGPSLNDRKCSIIGPV